MCSKMAAKLINSSDESSMGSAVYFSRRVLTENLKGTMKVLEKHFGRLSDFLFVCVFLYRI